MKFSKQRRGDRVLPVEITPMIDVVFLLIIFFMTSAQFARLTRADIELPREAGERTESDRAGLVINIDRDGQIIVNDQSLELDELVALISQTEAAEGGGALKLLVRADRNASTARLNQVVLRLRAAGVPTARIATEVP